MEISPKEYGLSSRVKLKLFAPDHIGIVKLVKSRIIQKDALKIIDIADKIKEKEPASIISVVCHDNICSKSVKLLNERGIDIVFTE